MKSTISILLCFLLIGYASATSQADEVTPAPNKEPQPEVQQPAQGPFPQGNVRLYGQPFVATKSIICNDSKVIYSLLKNEPVSEVPIFFGLILNEHGVAKMVTQIFIGKKSNSTFSVIESSNEGISCIISAGTGFDILSHYHEGEIQRGSGQEVNKGIWKMPQNVRMQN
jgi:hypothetical protein